MEQYILKLENSINILAFLGALVSSLFYWAKLTYYKQIQVFSLPKFCLIFSNCIIAGMLLERCFRYSYFPLSNLYESLLFLSWVLNIITIIFVDKLSIIGAIGSSAVTLIIGYANYILPPSLRQTSILAPALRSNWLMMHVSVMIFSYGLLIMGAFLSLIYVIVNNNLSQKSLNRMFYLPSFYVDFDKNEPRNDIGTATINRNKLSYETIESLSYKFISLGFISLTLGIISGSVWANEAWGNYWSWDPKETWALITWLVFATYLHIRINKKWNKIYASLVASLGLIVICFVTWE
uniref:Cytochrome c biogenesis protein CcsA n=1 Tax=Cyanidium caldarium TaxID=2771 RepID=CCSA_CYACA|nr:cytochrome c biogenesis protein [Cyanidium caldarium]O19901.1 RecName: Full=Cytochrome c biogenesis protein CcsA [Cyanidium caldarium]AAB82688.1 unknown [Cyanidium caldarium]